MSDEAGTQDVVLVVEDEALVRMHGADIFEEAGYSVIEAASADEAVAILEQAPEVRLLFSDVDMPGSMDGLALAELVHARWPDIRLVITSGHRKLADADLPDDGRFVPKPYTSDSVLEEVDDLFGPQP